MDLKLKNKVILISGSSTGIGFFVAEAFLREGAKIQISGRNDRKLQATWYKRFLFYGLVNKRQYESVSRTV